MASPTDDSYETSLSKGIKVNPSCSAWQSAVVFGRTLSPAIITGSNNPSPTASPPIPLSMKRETAERVESWSSPVSVCTRSPTAGDLILY
jgi:hypothetical protein